VAYIGIPQRPAHCLACFGCKQLHCLCFLFGMLFWSWVLLLVLAIISPASFVDQPISDNSRQCSRLKKVSSKLLPLYMRKMSPISGSLATYHLARACPSSPSRCKLWLLNPNPGFEFQAHAPPRIAYHHRPLTYPCHFLVMS
jgi:hypothetical protein